MFLHNIVQGAYFYGFLCTNLASAQNLKREENKK
jgi:hypothetical protein